MTTDLDAGAATLAALQDPTTTAAWSATADAEAPGFGDWIVRAVFGGTYQRGDLSLRDRQLLNLGALAALGGVDPQLDGHVRTCVRVGLSLEQVADAFVHLAPYVGLPRAMAALRAVGRVREQG
ncbi:carboxymuconolactone decarboxylase family protein [Cellulomonas rhizosphaerae]|uniref:Carboxymuconolactone decarboxylase family protein n=1 Tax=Cellulomonas rhizosphaerae TaxID=2293719 RepID=A0A413RLK4_9CELL|nr:carboxymuconolactone decarboxylase family protein [Cellulomonas rhizosphaerae]RHA40736.1 carboxymuconolactone decarboxylase family protein [Cellulomonas rhizosphaerae]